MKSFLSVLLLTFVLSVNSHAYEVFGVDGINELHSSTGVCVNGLGEDSCSISVSAADNTKIDVEHCCFYVEGKKYSFAAITSFSPQFDTGKSRTFVGVTMNGYTSQSSRWTVTQKLTTVPLARLQKGPGSAITLIRDDRYKLKKREHNDRLWREEVLGAQYVSGGDIFANSTSGLILGQNAGVMYDRLGNRHILQAFENQTAIFLHLSSNETDWVGQKKPLSVDLLNYNPAGSSLVPMLDNNKFKVDTILKSPRQSGRLFLVYGNVEYLTAAEAISGASERYGLFLNHGSSDLVPVALIVQQRNVTDVNTIIDRRPCFVC